VLFDIDEFSIGVEVEGYWVLTGNGCRKWHERGEPKRKKKTQKQKIKRVVKVCVLSKRYWKHMGDCCPVENNIASIVCCCSWYVFVYK